MKTTEMLLIHRLEIGKKKKKVTELLLSSYRQIHIYFPVYLM